MHAPNNPGSLDPPHQTQHLSAWRSAMPGAWPRSASRHRCVVGGQKTMSWPKLSTAIQRWGDLPEVVDRECREPVELTASTCDALRMVFWRCKLLGGVEAPVQYYSSVYQQLIWVHHLRCGV